MTQLLGVHLDQIRRCTTVPYQMYISAGGLDLETWHQLESEPNLVVEEIHVPHDLSTQPEESYLQERLMDRAVLDGATHIVLMQPDVFPVERGWAERLAAELTDEAPVCALLEEGDGDTMARPNPACLMIESRHLVEHGLMLDPPEELEASDEWKAFLLRHGQRLTRPGTMYAYMLEEKGLSWTPLRRTNSRDHHRVLCGIYGDTIFRFGSMAAHVEAVFSRQHLDGIVPSLGFSKEELESSIPFRPRLAATTGLSQEGRRLTYRQMREELVRNPQGFIQWLRSSPITPVPEPIEALKLGSINVRLMPAVANPAA